MWRLSTHILEGYKVSGARLKRIMRKLMWRLLPKADKIEMWRHPRAVFLNCPVTVHSWVLREDWKVSGRGRKRLNESNWEKEWIGALLKAVLFQKISTRTLSLGSLFSSRYEHTILCLLASHCNTTADCQQTMFLFGSICFASVDFSDL